jgi:hypothetical protein
MRSLHPDSIDRYAIERHYLENMTLGKTELPIWNSVDDGPHLIEDDDDDDDGQETPAKAKSKSKKAGIKLNRDEFLNSQVFVAVAGCMRALGECLVTEKKGNKLKTVGAPLKQKELGTNLRKYSMPMPNRAVDLNAYTMRRLHLDDLGGQLLVGARSELPDNTPDAKFMERLFQATLMAFAGDPYQTARYERVAKPPSGQCFPRPLQEDVDHYINYLNSEFRRGVKFSKFIYRQFGKNVPSVLAGNHSSRECYIGFVKLLYVNFEDKVKAILDESKIDGRLDRFLFMYKYGKLLQSSAQAGLLDEYMFVSNQIILTMDELYLGYPLGEPTLQNLVCGGGSSAGADCIIHVTDPWKEKEKKDWAENRYTKEDAENYMSLSNPFLADIISQRTLDDIIIGVGLLIPEHLEMMLWAKDKDGLLRNLVNGREFSLVDVEHMLVSEGGCAFFIRLYIQLTLPFVDLSASYTIS